MSGLNLLQLLSLCKLNTKQLLSFVLRTHKLHFISLVPAQVKEHHSALKWSSVTHIFLCFEGTHYAERSPLKGFVPTESSALLKGTERCCFWSCDLLRWEEEQESRSLGQQVSEASLTSQLYNLCSPAYKTAALLLQITPATGASTLVSLVNIYLPLSHSHLTLWISSLVCLSSSFHLLGLCFLFSQPLLQPLLSLSDSFKCLQPQAFTKG